MQSVLCAWNKRAQRLEIPDQVRDDGSYVFKTGMTLNIHVVRLAMVILYDTTVIPEFAQQISGTSMCYAECIARLE